jgi:hypothetical protein
MLAAKTFYLLFYSSLSCLFPYLPLWFKRHAGLGERQLGILAALRPWVSFPAGALPRPPAFA